MFDKHIKKKLISQTVNSPLRTLLISLSLTLLLCVGLKWFVIDDDFIKLLPQNIPSKIIWDEIQEDFGASEVMLIAFGNKDSSIYREEIFNAVWDLTDSLEKNTLIEEVISIKTLNKIESLCDNEIDDSNCNGNEKSEKECNVCGGEWMMNVEELYPNKDLNKKEINKIKKYFEDNPNIKSRVLSTNSDYTSIMIRPKLDINMTVMVNLITPISESILKDFEIHYAGQIYITGKVPDIIKDDTFILMRLALLLMVIILLINFRNISAVMMILVTILLSMLSMFGFMGWMYKITNLYIFNFTMMNTSMPVVLLTIANSDGVHILTRFFREARKKKNVENAVKTTLQALFLPIFLTSFTTAIAFLAFIFSPIEQFIGYGICLAFGIIWAWILSTTLLPSIILIKNWNLNSNSIKKESLLEKIASYIGSKITNSPKIVLFIGFTIIFISFFGFKYIEIEVNTSKFFKPGNPIRESNDFVDNELTGSMNFLINTIGDHKNPEVLNDIDGLQSYLESFDKVNTSISIVDIVKQMNKTMHDDNDEYYTIPNIRGEINELYFMYSMSGDPDDFSSLVDPYTNYDNGLVTGMIQSISTKETVRLVKDLEQYIEQNITSNLKTRISGLAVFFRDMVDLIIKSSIISILVSILVIFLISWYFFKGIRWGLLAVVPLSCAVILNFGLMGFFGIQLSHITAILTAIIIGVGVDFAIHYISEFKRNLKKEIPLNDISKHNVDDVGYPILLDVLSNMGFVTLLFSALIPLNYMGGLMVFAMLSTSIGTLTLLASLIEINKEYLSKGK